MNLFHTLRQKAEFADIVFILMARSLCLTTQRNLTILQLERRCVCKRLAPYQISQEKMTARLGTLRRSFFLRFLSSWFSCAIVHVIWNVTKIAPPRSVSNIATSENVMVHTPFLPLSTRGVATSRKLPYPALRCR